MEQLLAERVVASLDESGIDFLSFVPESRLRQLIAPAEANERIAVVRASHEGTAVAAACGAAFVGRRPAAYMEATGLIAAMYSLESTAIQFGLPIVLLVSYVGSPGDHGTSGAFATFGRYLEAQVRALALPFVVFDTDERLEERIGGLVDVAQAGKLPAVGLFGGEFTRRPSEP